MSNIDVLLKAIEIEGGNISKVAARAGSGASRTALSLILSGKYKADQRKVLQRVADAYSNISGGMVNCPALKDEISVIVCRKYTSAIKDNRQLSDMTFGMVRDLCPYCPNF